jgi:hypothetical protein
LRSKSYLKLKEGERSLATKKAGKKKETKCSGKIAECEAKKTEKKKAAPKKKK